MQIPSYKDFFLYSAKQTHKFQIVLWKTRKQRLRLKLGFMMQVKRLKAQLTSIKINNLIKLFLTLPSPNIVPVCVLNVTGFLPIPFTVSLLSSHNISESSWSISKLLPK